MDVISAALTICSVCNRIIDWISNLSDKETLLKDISFTVLQVHDLLHPFTSSTFNRSGTGEYQLSQSIRSVGAVVRRIDEHIQVYQLKKTQKILAFLKPGAVIQKLKDDQTQLNHQLVILLASIAAVGYFRDHEKDEGSDRALAALTEKLEISSDTSSATMVAINTALDELKAEDAREFWKDYIGIKASYSSFYSASSLVESASRSTLLPPTYSLLD
ncbi:hypothetical protein CPB84DRAFT_1844219 [Gymnopilus junonius]|uniref:Uncharacterized protein n=1 Tax=Gymnopilus junonius TaxID=109634 RepID=A0A9P5TS00_GYMJU|nr:hypothetical protein CPB84DRAFT_1844219 [Gymnopilus junonius]